MHVAHSAAIDIRHSYNVLCKDNSELKHSSDSRDLEVITDSVEVTEHRDRLIDQFKSANSSSNDIEAVDNLVDVMIQYAIKFESYSRSDQSDQSGEAEVC